MLGYHALYSGPWAAVFGIRARRLKRSRFGLLPHEIAALNAR